MSTSGDASERTRDREVFFQIHKDLPREGPGDAASTARAFHAMKGLSPTARILDVGCGPGMQTLDLAALTGGRIVALDLHRVYLSQLRSAAVDSRLADRIRAVQASMFALPFSDDTFDALWAEGSIYIIGFEQGLRAWRRLLRHGGHLAASHLSWLTPAVPEEPKTFWTRTFPAMTTVDANIEIAMACGYEVVEHFVLPESAWWNDYYGPLEQRLGRLEDEYRGDAVAQNEIDSSREQLSMYRRFSECYGYVFYVMRRT